MISDKIIKLAQEEQVTLRNKYRFERSEMITIIIKSVGRVRASMLLMDLLGFSLLQCNRITRSVQEDDTSFMDACNLHLND